MDLCSATGAQHSSTCKNSVDFHLMTHCMSNWSSLDQVHPPKRPVFLRSLYPASPDPQQMEVTVSERRKQFDWLETMRILYSLAIVASFGIVGQAWVTPPHASRSRSCKNRNVALAATLDGKEIRGPLTPLGNFCLVKTKDTLSSSEGGILIPDQVSTHVLGPCAHMGFGIEWRPISSCYSPLVPLFYEKLMCFNVTNPFNNHWHTTVYMHICIHATKLNIHTQTLIWVRRPKSVQQKVK